MPENPKILSCLIDTLVIRASTEVPALSNITTSYLSGSYNVLHASNDIHNGFTIGISIYILITKVVRNCKLI